SDSAVGIIQIPKYDRLGRTSLLASRDDITVLNRPILLFRLDFGAVNPLDAVAAFFHYASAANTHVRVPRAKKTLGIPIRVEEKVESPHFIRAVVRAITRSNASVIDHFVQTLRAVYGCGHGAH